MGILSGWSMDVDGGFEVDPGEELGMFEKGARAPYFLHSHLFPSKYDFLVTPYLLLCFWREKLAEHSTKCSTRTPPPY